MHAGVYAPQVDIPDLHEFASALAPLIEVGAATGDISYDSITPADLPTGANVYLAYIDGWYKNIDQVKARFPSAKVLGISVLAEAADIYDCEPGNGTPADAPAYFQRARAAGIEVPTVYCPASWTSEVRAALASVTTSPSQYFIHSAHYGVGPHICGQCGYPQADNTQYADPGPYDISLLGARFLSYLFPAPKPAPVAPPPTPIGDTVQIINFTATTDANGWYCTGVTLPADKTKDNIVSVVVDCAGPYDGGWHYASAEVDYQPVKDGTARIVVKGEPNRSWTGRVFVA